MAAGSPLARCPSNSRISPVRPPESARRPLRRSSASASSLGRNAMGCDPRDRTRIDIARARCHDEPLGRSETHGGVNRQTARSRSHRGTAAQMADHKFQRIDGTLQEHSGTTRGPLATESVETVAAQLPLLDPRRRERVPRGGRFERGMERRVEARDRRHIRRETTLAHRLRPVPEDCAMARDRSSRRVGIESRHRSRRGG